MIKFLSGFVSGILVVVIIVVCCLFAVPIDSFTNMAGVEMPEGTEIKGMSIVEAGKIAIETIGQIDTKTLGDFKKTFGLDIVGFVKQALQISDTTLDSLNDCTFSQIGTEITKLPIQDILTATNITMDQQTTALIEPILPYSIFDLTNQESTKKDEAVGALVNGITVDKMKGLLPEGTLPNIPIFNDGTVALVQLFKPANLVIGNFLDVTTASEDMKPILTALKDCTILPDPENPDNYIATKIMTLPLSTLLPESLQSNKMLQSVTGFTINELKDPTKLNAITIGQLVGIDDTNPSTSKILVQLKDVSIGDLTSANAGEVILNKIGTLKIGELLPSSTTDGVLNELKEFTINDLKDDTKFKALTIAKLTGIDMTSPTVSPILKAFGKITIGDLTGTNSGTVIQDALNEVKVKDVITGLDEKTFPGNITNSTGVKFGEWSLNEISTNMTNLKVGNILTLDDTKLPGSLKDNNGNLFKDWALTDISTKMDEAVNGITIGSIMGTSTPTIFAKLVDDNGVAFNNWKIGEIGTKMDYAIKQLTVNDLLGSTMDTTTLPGMLYMIKGTEKVYFGDWKINDVSTGMDAAMQNLKVGDIIKGLSTDLLPGSLKNKKGEYFSQWKVSDVSSNMTESIETMNITTLFKFTTEDSKKTMLYKLTHDGTTPLNVVLSRPEGVEAPKPPYKPTDQITLDERMQVVMGEANLNTFVSWGILDKNDTALMNALAKPLGNKLSPKAPEKTLGDCTIEEIIPVLAKALELLAAIP